MSSKDKHYIKIDILRVFACIMVLLYHLNILKGGYLAVCTFFVLTGYLSVVSQFKKEKFSLLAYYRSRFVKIYLPLLLVVFLSIGAVSYLVDMNWLNLKPETTSILLGYNNFWQLGANLDYFARHVDSPFMHLWYIGILLQFELVFPLVYTIFKKIGDKTKPYISCFILGILSILSCIFFYKSSISSDLMVTYYSTWTRMFSLLFGVTLGFIHSYYGSLTFKLFRKKAIINFLFLIYMGGLLALCMTIDSTHPLFAVSMILVTLITCRMVDYGAIKANVKENVFGRGLRALANISYEIYLVQYPVIFLMQYIVIDNNLSWLIVVVITIVLAIILHFALNFKNKYVTVRFAKLCMCLLLVRGSLIGVKQYIEATDHTEEMKRLEEQLEINEQLALEKQEEYALKLKQEEEDWLAKLDSFKDVENEVKKVVSNLSVVGIGDSVMLGAVDNLYKQFPNGYFDAKISRTAWIVSGLLEELEEKEMLGNTIIINLGANGDCSESCKKKIIETAGERDIFWVNTTNDDKVHVNDKLKALEEKYDNVHVVDWNGVSKDHKEYFYADGIHLTGSGRIAYTETIYEAIYKVYLKKYDVKKEEAIKEHEIKQKSKQTFYGNDVLLNAIDDIHESFADARLVANQDYAFEKLKSDIQKDIDKKILTNRVVLGFDKTMELSEDEYDEILDMLGDREIYIISLSLKSKNILEDIARDNVKVIDFYNELEKNESYLMADRQHLTKDGNKALVEAIKENMN